MREELRRINSIGNKDGINLFTKAVFDNDVINIDAINRICDCQSSAQLNCNAAVLLFEDIDILKISESRIYLTDLGRGVQRLADNERLAAITDLCVKHAVHCELLDCTRITYDIEQRKIKIGLNAFLLSAAVYRNFLISVNVLNYVSDVYVVCDDYEEIFSKILAIEKPRLTEHQLLKNLEQQREQGDFSEEFVMRYERARLSNKKMPKRISQIDVCAGYDIVSYSDINSEEFDLFIEVKSYIGDPHFYWSSNEKHIASLLGKKYSIYLVDYERALHDEDYQPQIINNPVQSLDCGTWLVEPNSYIVKKI